MPNKRYTNKEIIEAVKREMSPSYASRLTTETKSAMQESFRDSLTDTPAFNEFAYFLFNRIGGSIAKSQIWENPLRFLKRPAMRTGSTLEEHAIRYAKARSNKYNKEVGEKVLFGIKNIDGYSNFFNVVRQDSYDATTDMRVLARAVESENGIYDLVSETMASMTNGANLDEYTLMTNLLREADNFNFFSYKKCAPLNELRADSGKLDSLLVDIRATVDNWRVASPLYNKGRVEMFALPEDVIIFMTPELKATMDVVALAAAFNLDLKEAKGRILTIPREYMAPGIEALVTTTDLFVVADTYFAVESQKNAGSSYTNHFLQVDQLAGLSHLANTLAFGAKEDSITMVEPKAISISSKFVDDDGKDVAEGKSGDTYELVVTVDNSTAPYSTTLLQPHHPRTRLTKGNMLIVSPYESADELVVENRVGSVVNQTKLKLTGEYVNDGSRDGGKVLKHKE
jgi:hypothetical protein